MFRCRARAAWCANLPILIHPNTGRERSDHLVHAVWLGEMLPIVNTAMLDESTQAEGPRATNTRPTLSP